MGFFGDICSSIGSAISSAASAVGSFVSGCVSKVSSAVGAVCSGAAKVCSKVIDTVGKVSDKIGVVGQIALAVCNPALAAIVGVVSAASKVMGVLKEGDKIEEIGEATTKVDKKPEDFESTNQYIDYVKDEIKSGKVEISHNSSPEERIAYTALGTSLAMKGIDEKMGVTTDVDFWGTMGKQVWQGKLDNDDVSNILTKVSNDKMDPKDIANYINGNPLESSFSKKEISNFLESALSLKPSITKDEISSKMDKIVTSDFNDKDFEDLEKAFKEEFGINDKF